MPHPDSVRKLVDERIELATVSRIDHQCCDGEEIWIAEDSLNPLLYWAKGTNQFRALNALKELLTRLLSQPAFFEAAQIAHDAAHEVANRRTGGEAP